MKIGSEKVFYGINSSRYLFLILYLLLILASVLNYACQAKLPKRYDGLIVVVDNKKQLPIRVWTNENYLNLNDFERFSDKISDTLRLPVDGYGYVYFSTKQTYGDTLLVASGDT